MNSRFGITIAAIVVNAIGVVSVQSSVQPAWAVRTQDYAPEQFVSVLNGFGYPVSLTAPLIDPSVQQAIRDFQAQNKLPVDGTLNVPTQDKAADLVRQLQKNLNRVIQPNPPLPESQFYGKQTESAVRLFQQKNGLPATGIATLRLVSVLVILSTIATRVCRCRRRATCPWAISITKLSFDCCFRAWAMTLIRKSLYQTLRRCWRFETFSSAMGYR
ncbi:MAG: peptidoglycan-binding protein [Leptolyngbyaceae cyanobacterium CSU_1_3]|nr:peptidoglycan-binding protein [Leptolyngbyaceae cyanobacterium CSU_1_3]